MVWTLLAFLCVLATKFLTSVRLRGLKAKMEAIQPHIDELRLKLAQSEDEVQLLKLQVAAKDELLNNLKDVVRMLEESLKQPVADVETAERVQILHAAEKDGAVAEPF